MKEENPKNLREKFTQWLDHLQQESWQLEMIISGLSLALIAGVYDNVEALSAASVQWRASSDIASYLSNLPIVIFLGWFFLLINLCIHLLLRGLWIATLGLRYVSGDIDYHKLGYNEKFSGFLKRRIGDFDSYIERLEKLCSSIFAFTFLIIFSITSFMLFITIVGFFSNILSNFIVYLGDFSPDRSFRKYISIPFFLMGLIYFIDFISLGWFKKRKKYFGWYMPVYRLVSWLTLANIYRPIYHNFADNKFGRIFAYLLIPYIVIFVVFFSFYIETHKYLAEDRADLYSFGRNDYDDKIEEADINRFLSHASIPSPYVKNGFLEIYLPYVPVRDDKVLDSICEHREMMKNLGIESSIYLGFSEGQDSADIENKKWEEEAAYSLDCLQKLWRISVNDSIIAEPDYLLISKTNKKGLKAVLDVDYAERGHHILKLERQYLKDEKLNYKLDEIIHFWKE